VNELIALFVFLKRGAGSSGRGKGKREGGKGKCGGEGLVTDLCRHLTVQV
jgi:hypothetical protein